MTKMATTDNLLFINQMADDLETWYAALETQALPGWFKWWPLVDLDLFYSQAKFSPLGFCMGKGQTVNFAETIVAYDI